MPSVEHSLNLLDFGQLRILAELWGIEFNVADRKSAVQLLASTLLDPLIVTDIYEALAPEAKKALKEILLHDGSLPWSIFERRYGPLREVGSGQRDRQKIYFDPVSPAEILWYRGFIAREFFDTVTGLQEFAYIPQDLMSLLPHDRVETITFPGRPALPAEYQQVFAADDQILDHACTLLACFRNQMSITELRSVSANWPGTGKETNRISSQIPPEILSALLITAGILTNTNQPDKELTREFLATPRKQALALLARNWRSSRDFNELRLLPGLVVEGEWQNDPLQARTTILSTLAQVSLNTWWSLPSFTQSVKQLTPDFQRPAGDYDSWFIRDRLNGGFLRGSENWDAVEGALIQFMIAGVMHWLGIVDIGSPKDSPNVTAFRIRQSNAALLNGETPARIIHEREVIHIQSNAQIMIPRLAPRTARYLLARFCQWNGEKKGVYHYRLTPTSLEHARRQDLSTEHLISLLQKYSHALPPNLIQALKRLENQGIEARIQPVIVLRLRSPDLLEELRNSRAARFLGNPLGPTTIILKPGSQQKVMDVLAELGYLGELIE